MDIKKIRITLVLIFTTNIVNAFAIKVTFNPLANRLHLLDQISKSLPDFFCIPEYEKSLGKFFNNCEVLHRYQNLRKRRQLLPLVFIQNVLHDNLFAPHPKSITDEIFNAFFMFNMSDNAIDNLEQIIGTEDVNILKNVLDFYVPVFTLLEGDYALTMRYNERILQSSINQRSINEYLKKISLFYNTKIFNLRSITLLWSPSSHSICGRIYGEHLMLIVPNKKISNPQEISLLQSILIREATRYISGIVAEELKKNRSSVFLQHISQALPKNERYLFVLEEPIALAVQMLFIKQYFKDSYDEGVKHFNTPLALRILPLLEEYIAKTRSIDEDFIKKCAKFFNASDVNYLH